MHTKNEYIGVFDSGLGGISVLKALVKQMPQEKFLYYGDSANAPYGNKTTAQVQQLTLSNAEYLISRGCKALVIACNTATAAAIKILRSTYPDTIIIGIEPALKVAADRFPQGNIGVMATPVTLREEKFHQQMERFPNIKVTAIRVPGLVELVENGHWDDEKTRRLLKPILSMYENKLDAVVLGCTHYPFAANVIGECLGENTQLLDGSAGTARETQRRLAEQNLLYDGTGEVILENSSADPVLLTRAMELLEERE